MSLRDAPLTALASGPTPGAEMRPLTDPDWELLPEVFAAAFHRVPPFSLLDADRRGLAAVDCLATTRAGGSGPLVPAASWVVRSGPGVSPTSLLGAILVTLMPAGDLENFADPTWCEQPPDDAVSIHWGRPHVTWVFVAPKQARRGIGTALLRVCTESLRALGYDELASTVLLGNESSLLWHWRAGFRLLHRPSAFPAQQSLTQGASASGVACRNGAPGATKPRRV